MNPYLFTRNLGVGYEGRALIRNIELKLERGRILTLIGPNGAGKSTILKTITRQLAPVDGTVWLDDRALRDWPRRSLAQRMAVVLTERVHPELMTAAEVVAMGRYPYTGLLGRLEEADRKAVRRALERVHALDLAERDFTTLSDGQRQRILLARALCQQPELIVLDEPTAYLDIRHKLELLEILRCMAREQKITILMSLHEIDLAVKASDLLLCVQEGAVAACGPPEQVLQDQAVERLYGMRKGAYDPLFGSVELPKPQGEPRVFVVAGAGYGIPCYRALQKKGIPFASGILFENDLDFQVARQLSDYVVASPAFESVGEKCVQQAAQILVRCERVIDAGTPIRSGNQANAQLLRLAREHGLPVDRP